MYLQEIPYRQACVHHLKMLVESDFVYINLCVIETGMRIAALRRRAG
jgi:hypothetical protein